MCPWHADSSHGDYWKVYSLPESFPALSVYKTISVSCSLTFIFFLSSLDLRISFPPSVLSPVETLTPFHKLFVGFEVSQGLASVCPQSYIHPEFYKGINFFAFGTRERHLFTLSLPLPPHVEPASIFKASMPAPTILSVPHLLIHCSFLWVSPFPFFFYMDLCDYNRHR